MKFTEKDIKYFLDCGYFESDIPQIKRAKRFLRLTNEKGEKMTQDKAVEVLGRENFLSGLSRASFHWTSSRESENGKHTIYFDCSKLFEAVN